MSAILQPCSAAPQLLLQRGRPQYDARAQESAAQHVAHPRGGGGEQAPLRTLRRLRTSRTSRTGRSVRRAHQDNTINTDEIAGRGDGDNGYDGDDAHTHSAAMKPGGAVVTIDSGTAQEDSSPLSVGSSPASSSSFPSTSSSALSSASDVGADAVCGASGWTALFEATLGGHADVVRLLIAEGGARTFFRSRGPTMPGSTALHVAAKMGAVDVVKALLTTPSVYGYGTNRGGGEGAGATGEREEVEGREGRERAREGATDGPSTTSHYYRRSYEGIIYMTTAAGFTPLYIAAQNGMYILQVARKNQVDGSCVVAHRIVCRLP